MVRLGQVAKKLNVGVNTITEYLGSKGFKIDPNPNTKITGEQVSLLEKEFAGSLAVKQEASALTIGVASHGNIVIDAEHKLQKPHDNEEDDFFYTPQQTVAAKKEETPVAEEKKSSPAASTPSETSREKLPGLKVLGTISLDKHGNPTPQPKPAPTPEPVKEEAPVQPVVQAAEKAAEKQEEKVVAAAPVPEPPKEAERPEPSTESSSQTEAPIETFTAPAELTEAPVSVKEPAIDRPAAREDRPLIRKSEHAPEAASKPSTAPTKPAPAPVKPVTALPNEAVTEPTEDDTQVIEAKADRLKGLKVVGKIELPVSGPKGKKSKPVASSDDAKGESASAKKRKRKRMRLGKKDAETERPVTVLPVSKVLTPKDATKPAAVKAKGAVKKVRKEEVSEKDVREQYKKTLAKLGGQKTAKSSKSKYRKEKRSANAAAEERRLQQEMQDAQVLRITEFISAHELASLMDVSINELISKCLSMGLFVSINQRLDAENIEVIADEFGFAVEFASPEEEAELLAEDTDEEEDLVERAPIVTIMGHVDHGKTSLLDYIRKSNVAAGEAGGITQHIGAYDVTTASGRRIVFLDTPGHEAFTAMRARGAKLTDVAIIVVAADDNVMPQTVEAINHAQVAGVPIVFAINKVDKPGANPTKIKESLAKLNFLVEDWGGKYQSYEISAKQGLGIEELLEGVLLEADILQLKANPDRQATGTIIEASLDKGRGYVATVLVQNGTMQVGDVILAGPHYGKVKAMFDHRGKRLKEVGPSAPVLVLGLNGAPQAGDRLNVMESEREAREIAAKREQINRELSIRATRRTTLSDIGKRIAIGNFQKLNLILKGDVDGSVEALTDSLLKLSTDQVEVNIIHRAVGPISESDILLAAASDAIVIGFQVRPTTSAKKIAERDEVEIRLYSIIYDAINEVKQAIEGMLAPEMEEIIVGNAQVREVFKISKVGTIAGCMVTEGYIKRNSKIRLVRDGIVVYGGENGGDIVSLKRFKDDVAEVKQGYDCGIGIRNFNDIKEGDVIEAFEQREVKKVASK